MHYKDQCHEHNLFSHLFFPIVTKVASYDRGNTATATLFSHENLTDRTPITTCHFSSCKKKKKKIMNTFVSTSADTT